MMNRGWKRTLDISDLWQASIPRGGTLTAQEIAKGVAERIGTLPRTYALASIKDAFLALADEPDTDFNDLVKAHRGGARGEGRRGFVIDATGAAAVEYDALY